MILVRSQSLDPYRNLAIEEILLDRDSDDRPVLFLWRSADTVVIGKNQNPWQECNFPRMRAAGIRLARRATGGGAVLHDEGNLNFSVLCPRSAYRQEQVFDAVIGALRAVGLPAQRMGKSSLAVDGRKVSGNAFCYRRNRVLHHGTLLVGSDLGKFNVLEPPPSLAVTTRAVQSDPARVVNLAALQRGLHVELMAETLTDAFAESFGVAATKWTERDLGAHQIDAIAGQLQEPEWVLDHGPDFQIKVTARGPPDNKEIHFQIKGGRIAAVHAVGFEAAQERLLRDRLPGCRPIWPEIRERLGGSETGAQACESAGRLLSAAL